jgi:hypothetical protein
MDSWDNLNSCFEFLGKICRQNIPDMFSLSDFSGLVLLYFTFFLCPWQFSLPHSGKILL